MRGFPLIRFIIVGVGASAITFAVTWCIVVFEYNLLIGSAIAAMAGTCFSFIGNAHFTFSAPISADKASKFILVYLLTGMLYAVLLEHLLSNMHLLFAFLISLLVTTVINFLAQRYWIFR